MFDLLTTFRALSTGQAAEINPVMGMIIGIPALAVIVKMMGAYVAAKILEKMEARNSYCAVLMLIALNAYLGLICLNNLRVCAVLG